VSPALILAVVIALVVVVVSRSHPTCNRCDENNTAAQANLQTALTGAETYYASNSHSYVGVDGGPQLATGVSSIAELEIGLTFIPGHQASTGPNIISIVAASPSVVVVTAYSKAIQTCWGILRVARARAGPYFPAYPSTGAAGLYYFHGGSSSSAACMAATVMPTALNATGFPAA
jgi:hypothetical protein